MEPKNLLQADYLDIVFDNRNKKYGSYELRKNYDRRMRKGTLFLLAGVVALSSFSLIGNDHRVIAGIHSRPDTLIFVTQPPPPPAKKVIPPAQPPAVAKPKFAKISTEPVITTKVIPDDKQMTEIRQMGEARPGTTNQIGDSADIGPNLSGKPKPEIITNEAPVKPLVYVEQMPQFIGSMDAYIGSHLQYPEAARANGIEGRVLIQFVINEDGAVSNAIVVRGIGGGCDEEALRMINTMPKWKPGRQNGTAVKVLFTLPIKFVLN